MTATKTTEADLSLYRSFDKDTLDFVKDDYGMTEIVFEGTTDPVLVISGSEGWCGSCACLEGCCGYGETVYEIYNLRKTDDDVLYDEGERLCESCGEWVQFDDMGEANEAARWDAAERAWEMAGDR
jgi:hypothetical protein